MKRLLTIAMLLMLTAATYAQKDVTKFLGIPVDGTKSAMIQKLKAKGFTENPYVEGVLNGEFNGTDVNVHIVTNNNKVYRIMVCDANTVGETDIRIRFNNLCRQFSKNPKYKSASLEGYTISEDEDISYEMLAHNKRYEAVYFQIEERDSVAIKVKELFSADNYTDFKEQYAELTPLIESESKRVVWFMINERYGKYQIIMYYDNEYNKTDGEDL